MKHGLTLPLAALLTAAPLCAGAAAPKAKAAPPAPPKGMTVTFGTAGTPPRFVTARPRGALEALESRTPDKPAFQLIDLNGGPLKTGDRVQIEFAPGGAARSSFWREDGAKVTRMGGRPNATCVFVARWKKPNTALTLQTASGHYVAAPANGGALVTTAKANDPAAVFTLIKKG